jgi:hypothetical protein
MFDLGDFANGNVRVALDLRRRRNGNGNGNSDARHRGHDGVGNINVVGNIDIDRNLRDVGRSDILRNGGNVGADGNVRLRLKQHCFIVVSNVDIAHNVERPRSNRSPVGILPDWQSWG